MELNANIKTLQLGCGGVNNAIGSKAGCDIDISNIALSGLNESYDSTGSPKFNGERAGTSAQIHLIHLLNLRLVEIVRQHVKWLVFA